ncbi:RNA helicase [Mycena leptocephala]|nr:RNA helicase [Mycena leptocephala]
MSNITCPQLLSSGVCKNPSCPHRHNALSCELCGLVCGSLNEYTQHNASKRHLKNARGESGGVVFCPACQKHISGRKNWVGHAATTRHKKIVAQMGLSLDIDPEEVESVPGHTLCSTCNTHIQDIFWSHHQITPRHKARERFISFQTALDEAERDKNVTLRQDHNGRAEDRLEILFEDVQLRKRFIIARILRVIVGNRGDHEILRPIAPYVPRKRTSARQPETTIIEGVRPPSSNAVPYVVPLPEAAIPSNLASTLSTGNTMSIVTNIRRLYLPPVLDSKTYARHFKHLLWIEEFRMKSGFLWLTTNNAQSHLSRRDLERYDIPDARLVTKNDYYFLDVPGLAEKRPSVLVGDCILVQKHGSTHGHWFGGGVHVVRKEEVGLKFNKSFRATLTDRFNRMRALPSAFHVPKTPYPTQASARLKMFNPLIATNAPQLQAVVSIVKRQPGSVPFVIFGPPGTGKTVTMVEAIRQVLTADPHARILACAPSNSAADLIASRLMALSTDELFRFYALSRNKEQVPLELREYTYAKPDGHFSVPPLARMKCFRIVVTTCISASVVSGIGIPPGHYTHIFCDEAGQATEPEVMIAIKTMADSNTNIILSGDPKQLGPIIRSAVARELGLETSYIERLMKREIYDEKKGYGASKRSSVVKLTKNFRSHNAILKFPNERFYGGELQQLPIVFHAIKGKDDREAASPSFFNIDEVSQVKEYIQSLKADRRFRIMTWRHHAVPRSVPQDSRRLRAVANGVKWAASRERRVIIISTVRSSREFVEYDLRHTLGFVANPRRFNVAVTRAQALLIVIGDPDVLSLDPLWRSFLNYIYTNGGWTGADISWDPRLPVDAAEKYDEIIRQGAQRDMNAFTRRMEELTIAGVAAEEGEGDGDDVNVDRPWQDAE